MNIFDYTEDFEYDKNRNHIFGIKSAIVWGHHKETNSIYPLLYISKPKNITQEDYELMLDKLKLNFEL